MTTISNVCEGIMIGDLHLGQLVTLFPENHLDLQMAEIRQALDYAVDQGLPYVFYLGDISHSATMDYDCLLAFLTLLHQYDDKIESHIILGNHDVANVSSNALAPFVRLCELEKFKNVHIYEKPTQVILNDVPINFLPFPHNQPIKSKTKTVNIAHIERKGSTLDNGRVIKTGFEPEGKDIWVVGHIHTFQTVPPYWYHPGTLYQTTFGEELPKGFAHFKFKIKEGKLKHHIDFMETTPGFILEKLIIEKRSDIKKLNTNPNHLFKVLVSEGVKVPDNLLTEYPNIIDIKGFSNEKEIKEIEEQSSLSANFTVKTGLKSFFKAKGSKAQYKRALEILAKFESSL